MSKKQEDMISEKEKEIVSDLTKKLSKEFFENCKGSIKGAILSYPTYAPYAISFAALEFALMNIRGGFGKECFKKEYVMELVEAMFNNVLKSVEKDE